MRINGCVYVRACVSACVCLCFTTSGEMALVPSAFEHYIIAESKIFNRFYCCYYYNFYDHYYHFHCLFLYSSPIPPLLQFNALDILTSLRPVSEGFPPCVCFLIYLYVSTICRMVLFCSKPIGRGRVLYYYGIDGV